MFRRRAERRAANTDRSIQVQCLDSSRFEFTLEVSVISRNVIRDDRSYGFLV